MIFNCSSSYFTCHAYELDPLPRHDDLVGVVVLELLGHLEGLCPVPVALARAEIKPEMKNDFSR